MGLDLADLAIYVVVLVALGVVLARWVPNAAAGPVAVIGLFVLIGTVTSDPTLEALALWVIPVGGWGWHLVYLIGLAVLLGAVAVLKHGMSKIVGLWLGIGLVLAVVGGTASAIVYA
jgi:hypothetical protein